MLKHGITLLASLAIILLPTSAITGEMTLKIIMQELRRNFLDVHER